MEHLHMFFRITLQKRSGNFLKHVFEKGDRFIGAFNKVMNRRVVR